MQRAIFLTTFQKYCFILSRIKFMPFQLHDWITFQDRFKEAKNNRFGSILILFSIQLLTNEILLDIAFAT